jgi:superfamily II RNA helicase
MDEGDILRGIRRTLDVSKQISKAPNIDQSVQAVAAEAVSLMERDIVVDVV